MWRFHTCVAESVTARAGSLRKLVVTNRDDLELLVAARSAHGDHVTDRTPEQSRSDRRYPGDPTAGRIDLVGSDDADRALVARLVGDHYRRTEVDLLVVFEIGRASCRERVWSVVAGG